MNNKQNLKIINYINDLCAAKDFIENGQRRDDIIEPIKKLLEAEFRERTGLTGHLYESDIEYTLEDLDLYGSVEFSIESVDDEDIGFTADYDLRLLAKGNPCLIMSAKDIKHLQSEVAQAIKDEAANQKEKADEQTAWAKARADLKIISKKLTKDELKKLSQAAINGLI